MFTYSPPHFSLINGIYLAGSHLGSLPSSCSALSSYAFFTPILKYAIVHIFRCTSLTYTLYERMLPWDTAADDQHTLDEFTAPDIPSLDPRNRSPSASGSIPLSLVIHRDTARQVLHWAVVWPAYDKATAQRKIGYKVIELRDNTDRATSTQSPYKFRFYFKRVNSPTIRNWTTYPMGNYGPDTRIGFLSAFQQWDSSGGGNCISCITDVLRYLATYGLLGDLGEEHQEKPCR